MKVPFFDLTQQYQALKPEVDKAIQGVLDRCEYISGQSVSSFEKNFAHLHRAKYCVAVSSGTSALHIALWALGLQTGDEVIVPSHTFIATAAAVSLAGGKPIFVDSEEKYYNIDPRAIEKAITKKTRAIIAVHLYGQPAEIDTIAAIAKKHHLWLIEDCAQAHGAEYKGVPVGTFGICGCFSFYPSKNLGAFGEGGAVVTQDEALYQKMLMLRNHGSSQKYEHPLIGQNYRMHELQGAILDVKLKHLQKWTEARRKLAESYRHHLKDIPGIQLPAENPHAKHVYHLYVIRTKQREKLMEHLKKQGIATGIHYPIPCHKQECFASPLSLPTSEKLAEEVLSLPLFPEMTEEQVAYTAQKIKEFAHAQ